MNLNSLAIPSFRVIGSFELPLLLSVRKLGEDAYGKALAEALTVDLGRVVTVGQVSRALNNLERLGVVVSRSYLPAKRKRGQRSRLVFSLTEEGHKVLRKITQTSTTETPQNRDDPPAIAARELVST